MIIRFDYACFLIYLLSLNYLQYKSLVVTLDAWSHGKFEIKKYKIKKSRFTQTIDFTFMS